MLKLHTVHYPYLPTETTILAVSFQPSVALLHSGGEVQTEFLFLLTVLSLLP